MTKAYREGGLKMIDVNSYIYCLKIKWLKNCIYSNSKCYRLVSSLFDIDKLFNTGKLYCLLIMNKIKNAFWSDVLKAYSIFIDKFQINNIEQLLHMPLFYNHMFITGNDYIFIANLYSNGFRFVKDIINQHGEFKDIQYLELVTGKKINFLHYHNLKKQIKSYMLKFNISVYKEILTVQYPILSCYMKPVICNGFNKKYISETLSRNTDKPSSVEK